MIGVFRFFSRLRYLSVFSSPIKRAPVLLFALCIPPTDPELAFVCDLFTTINCNYVSLVRYMREPYM